MSKKMLINAIDREECRVAMIENGVLEEFYVESTSHGQLKGNIYKGKVTNIEPGLQACFVDLDGERNGFLQIDEIHPEYFREGVDASTRRGKLQHLISPGQELLVQVVKDATGQKRPTLTTYLSIASRNVVLMPGRSSGGVSRKIEDEEERSRLKEVMADLTVPEGISVIFRTAASGRPKRELLQDAKSVLRLWQEIRKRGQEATAPELIYKEQDLAIRFLRDYFSPEIKEVIVDDRDIHRKAMEFMKIIAPRLRNRFKRYRGKEPLFSHYNLEPQIESICENRVQLKSGGSIVIEPTEALISVDVNSGKATQGKGLEDTAFRTNVEAAEEIARQLRLRDLAGLVVIDFIDMRDKRHQKELLKQLRENLKTDRARTKVSGISKFGMVELSRQRLGTSIQQRTSQQCPYCKGKGLIKTPEASALEHFRRIWHKVSAEDVETLELRVPVDIASCLLNQKRASLLNLENQHRVSIKVTPDSSLMAGESRLEASLRKDGDG